nr:protein NRT1/ PTR FAMILY 6.4-like [Tanacetum cinerariifolium]
MLTNLKPVAGWQPDHIRDIRNLQGDMHFSSSESANTVTNCMGSLNLLALFGGFLADAKLGRFLAIVLFSSICTIGVTLLTLATAIPSMKPPPCEDSGKCIEANTSQQVMLYISLYTLALGGGGIKSNVSAFGSDQFDKSDAKEEKAMIYSFNRFFFCVSLGSLFATTVMDIQDKEGRKWGYGISAGTMIIALVVLLCGTKFYRCLDKAAIVGKDTNEDRSNLWPVSTVAQVEEVKMVINLIPIWSTGILFWTIRSQIFTFTIEQATIMNRRIGHFEIPAGSFSVFLILPILLFTSLNERVVVPMARKITRDPKGLSSLQRIGIGLALSVAGMVAAAICEKKRREMSWDQDVKISGFSHATTRNKGKEIAKPITPTFDSDSEEDSDPEQAQRDKDMQKKLALIAKYFKKIYKPTNKNLITSSNSRNKNVDVTS